MQQMTCAHWVACELKATGKTTWEFFAECWRRQRPPEPPKVTNDAHNYNRAVANKHLTVPIPYYVSREHQSIIRQNYQMPSQAVHCKLPDLVHGDKRAGLRLIDDGTLIRYPMKGADGKWHGV